MATVFVVFIILIAVLIMVVIIIIIIHHSTILTSVAPHNFKINVPKILRPTTTNGMYEIES